MSAVLSFVESWSQIPLILQTLLCFGLPVFLLVWFTLWITFPKRIKSGLKSNSMRLNGTQSRRREKIEQFECQGFFWRSMSVVGIVVVLVSFGATLCHQYLIPVDLASRAIGEFRYDQDDWKRRLTDPSRGNLSVQYSKWQESNGVESKNHLIHTMRSLPFWLAIFATMLLVTMLTLGRTYINSLVRFEQRLKQRHQNYLTVDMESRHRAIEKTARQEQQTLQC